MRLFVDEDPRDGGKETTSKIVATVSPLCSLLAPYLDGRQAQCIVVGICFSYCQNWSALGG